MVRTRPWHAPDDSAYHDNTECLLGQELPVDRRRDGEGGKRLCPLCAALNKAEEVSRP
ncbi:MAG: hypothetical protein H0V79_02180 [Actinobacteria bacterium]|nr:hypothetical protein [Actinomycetota bacterium]